MVKPPSYEPRLLELVEYVKELAATELPGQYSSDGLLMAACTLLAMEHQDAKATPQGEERRVPSRALTRERTIP